MTAERPSNTVRLQDLEIFLVKLLPDSLLLKLGLDLFLACKPQLISQSVVGKEPGDRLSECWRITHRKEKTGLAIRDDIYDPGRRRSYDRDACRLGLKNNCGEAFPMAWQD